MTKVISDSNILNRTKEKNATTKERFAKQSIFGMITAGKTIKFDNIYITLL